MADTKGERVAERGIHGALAAEVRRRSPVFARLASIIERRDTVPSGTPLEDLEGLVADALVCARQARDQADAARQPGQERDMLVREVEERLFHVGYLVRVIRERQVSGG